MSDRLQDRCFTPFKRAFARGPQNKKMTIFDFTIRGTSW